MNSQLQCGFVDESHLSGIDLPGPLDCPVQNPAEARHGIIGDATDSMVDFFKGDVMERPRLSGN